MGGTYIRITLLASLYSSNFRGLEKKGFRQRGYTEIKEIPIADLSKDFTKFYQPSKLVEVYSGQIDLLKS